MSTFDAGTNVGLQIRKLYEPHLYPNASILNKYDKYFGPPSSRTSEVCTVGFEPNPVHQSGLQELEDSYNRCGFKIKLFTKTAVSNYNGKSDFFTDRFHEFHEWGASLMKQNNNSKYFAGVVEVIRLSDFIMDKVATRKIPNIISDLPPTFMLKMDIEGSEIETVPDLMVRGCFHHTRAAIIERHERWFNSTQKREMSKNVLNSLYVFMRRTQAFDLLDGSDEKYQKSVRPLPKCQ